MTKVFNNKLFVGIGLMFIVAITFIGTVFLSTNLNFLVAQLGFDLSTAQTIADLIMAGSTIATIIGVIGAATGLGLVLIGAWGALRAIAKNQGKQAVINY